MARGGGVAARVLLLTQAGRGAGTGSGDTRATQPPLFTSTFFFGWKRLEGGGEEPGVDEPGYKTL